MHQAVQRANSACFKALADIWENSVRATHGFLTQQDIAALKPKVLNDYLPAVDVYLYRDDSDHILGFIGVSAGKVEMLFVSPQSRGLGVGKALLHYALTHLSVETLDVNEQNPQAVGFYQHMNFEIVGRSARDGEGNPFPLLHMKVIMPCSV